MTGVNVNGRNNWIWAFQNAVATYLAFDEKTDELLSWPPFCTKEDGSYLLWLLHLNSYSCRHYYSVNMRIFIGIERQ